jgi:hypothetical protein
LRAAHIVAPDQMIQLGRAPNLIDILTSLTGVPIEEVWDHRVKSEMDAMPVAFIAKDTLVKNKRAAGWAQDQAALESLGEL